MACRPDGDPITHEWDLDGDGVYGDTTGATPSWAYPEGPAGFFIGLKVADPVGESDTDTAYVRVLNVAPTVTTPTVAPAPSDEGQAVVVTAGFADPGVYDSHTCTVDHGDGTSPVAGTVTGHTCNGPSHVYGDNGDFTVTVKVTDDDGGSGSAGASHEVLNVAPAVTLSSTAQTVQYSDSLADVTVTATDVAADSLSAAATWSSGGSFQPGLPDSLDLVDDGCQTLNGVKTCEWTLSGLVRVPAGTYTVRITVTDDDGGSTASNVTITVTKEDAIVAFGLGNPIAIEVTGSGSDKSMPFTLYAYVHEAPESGLGDAAGDINLAEVALMLEPVGPGGVIGPVACTSTGDVTEFDYSAILEVACNVSGIPVNAYVATVSIVGAYYQGNTDEDVVVVYDPSLGFTTGGGWFAWPGTGERTSFGYTMKYNKKRTSVQGSMVVIRHTADGDRYRIKSNALFGLALGETSDMGWATFLGKATYIEPEMDEALGNHSFTVYVEDRGEPSSGNDRFWLEVRDKEGTPVALTMSGPATTEAVELGGGNIVVPHRPRMGGR